MVCFTLALSYVVHLCCLKSSRILSAASPCALSCYLIAVGLRGNRWTYRSSPSARCLFLLQYKTGIKELPDGRGSCLIFPSSARFHNASSSGQRSSLWARVSAYCRLSSSGVLPARAWIGGCLSIGLGDTLCAAAWSPFSNTGLSVTWNHQQCWRTRFPKIGMRS